ncbi:MULTISPECIES: FecR family protein [Bacteroides]|uniref:FecR family protein n=1 Tax=Bacteroides TaxID=816 RepID=UPI000E44DE75|nr:MULTISPECIES: FecR family protein [Bacteroides]MBS7574160.1 FecR family protein [Bacteroides propionicigenes]RGM27070.1 FecR family protein [Bacteroides sp. OM08-17BH]
MKDELLLLFFQGKTTNEQSRLITEWLASDKENLKYYQKLCQIFTISFWSEERSEQNIEKAATTNKLYIIKNIARIAAIFLIGFFLNNLIDYYTDKEEILQELYVPIGQNAQLTLADGTRVFINAGSTLSFPNNFNTSERKVHLSGEAYFEVKSDKDKPFVVSTSQYNITALGTTFNVYAYPNSKQFEASLLSGSIKVENCNLEEAIYLKPDQRVVLSDNQLKVCPIQNKNYFLWCNGILYFDEPLMSVFNKLETYFDVTIEVAKESSVITTPQRFVGKFRMRDGLQHILSVLQVMYSFAYELDDESNTIFIK